MVAVDPRTYEELWWGKKAVGLRVSLSAASPAQVEALLRSAWERKAPRGLVRGERGRQRPAR